MLTVHAKTGGLKWGIGCLAIAALLIPHPAWMILLVCFGGAWGLAYGWLRVVQGKISAERQLHANWVAIGDLLVEEFVIHNRSWLPILSIEVSDHSNVPGYRPAFVVAVGGNRSRDWRQAAICTTRGHYQLGPWSLKLSDPFGLYELVIDYSGISAIVIHPPILPTLPIGLPIGNRDGGRARRKRGWHAQLNAAGVRHYRPNDPLHHIHWRTTARRNTPFVREFEQDAAGDVWLLLDMMAANQIGTGELGSEEQAVLLAATLLDHVLQRRRAVGLAAYSSQPKIVQPGRGAQQRWRMLEVLATISADSSTTLASALRDVRRLMASGSALQIVTAAATCDEWLPALQELQQLGIAIHVALFERGSYGATGNALRVQEQLWQNGIVCELVRRGDLRVNRPKRSPKTQ